MTENRIQQIRKALEICQGYSNEQIESSVRKYISNKLGKIDDLSIEGYTAYNDQLVHQFEIIDFPVDIEYIIEFFEALLEKDTVTVNGIVFTPKYIADYIAKEAFTNFRHDENIRVLDPSCGCGIFLISFAELLHKELNLTYVDIFNNCIFGLEIDSDNARRCRIVIELWTMINGENPSELLLNILCTDSLKTDWDSVFGNFRFQYIVGNPPYVNTHDMSKETAKFLKNTFSTTKTGVYNIFYAFIEHGMKYVSENGVLSYIIPNNFLTIKSAVDLRKYITDNYYLDSIIDFSGNMVFKPVRTYNCIIRLSKNPKSKFNYVVMPDVEDIKEALDDVSFDLMDSDKLDVNGWNLVDKETRNNLSKIESQFLSIKEFVRTGIATLRDDVFMVNRDVGGFYKNVGGIRYDIEPGIVKELYKIPDLKDCDDIDSLCRYIIFPYKKGKDGFVIIPEEELNTTYPLTYQYLMTQKSELDSRDKGKPNPIAWYAYGRTQGLNKYGKKLVFPTFANKPKFIMIENEYSLFCNGYAVFENAFIDLNILQRILNSKVMQYYVNNTSYSIEGGYYCYQKRYIEKFSLPLFSEEEKKRIVDMSADELDDYLIEKYNLNI